MLFFIVGTVLLLLNALRDVFPELFSLDKLYEISASGDAGTVCLSHTFFLITDNSYSDDKLEPVRNVFTKFWLALSRVPNENKLIHR